MALLIAGIALWTITHIFPAAAPGVRNMLVKKLGEGLYKGLFALDIVFALVLIVLGWKATIPAAIYAPPLYASPVPAILMAIALVLFVASSTANNLKRFVRHPQMTAVLFWAAGHLLANGDDRSIVLFGGLGVWAALEIIFISRREGRWKKSPSVPHLKDVIVAVIAAIVFATLLYLHAALFGVTAIPA